MKSNAEGHSASDELKEADSNSSLSAPPSAFYVWLDRLIIFWLFVMAAFAPHSIAVTQGAWLCGLIVWAISFLLRPRFHRTPLDLALLGFIALTLLSSLFSYAPDISLSKMRAVSLFIIIYFVAENVTSLRVVRLLVLTLVASCMVNVLYTFGERVVGRGVKVEGVHADSPLYAAGVRDGDTILKVDDRALRDAEELAAALTAPAGDSSPKKARLLIYRYEWMPTFEAERGRLLSGQTSEERLGVKSWSRGRDWRASGFYGHYVTYAEMLQLVASLAFGLFIALRRKASWQGLLLALSVAGMCGALLLTVTRASLAAFLLSSMLIVLVGAGRRAVLVVLICALPLALFGLLLLQQKRNVGFIDSKDDSINWRKTVQREGLNLLVSKPRHLLVGVGMDSIKRYWREWGLFRGGQIPMGHMHSNLLQLALERGLPALLMWLAWLFLYGRMLWRLSRAGRLAGWIERGLVLGALGGLIGFFTSGLVHYNFGDSEDVMILFIIMGLCLVVEREARRQTPVQT
ncbi:MAG TPA: O-antigen ligase family protein [Pyrinomonadaceae bacterium]|nr:O-antigen ligase family protein [Pyrinomonadaceae bacterium]